MSYRPPSCDLLTPKINDCPLCGGKSVRHERLLMIKCINSECNLYGPNNDPLGHKWNTIPRRSGVAELLGDIDLVAEAFELTEWGGSNFIKTLKLKADRLRKEWGLL